MSVNAFLLFGVGRDCGRSIRMFGVGGGFLIHAPAVFSGIPPASGRGHGAEPGLWRRRFRRCWCIFKPQDALICAWAAFLLQAVGRGCGCGVTIFKHTQNSLGQVDLLVPLATSFSLGSSAG